MQRGGQESVHTGADHEHGSGQRQAAIFWGEPRCRQRQVGVAGQFPSPLAGTFGECAFVVGLDPPRDAFDEPRGTLNRADH